MPRETQDRRLCVRSKQAHRYGYCHLSSREHLHDSRQGVLAAMGVSIPSKEDSQAMSLDQGVCNAECGKARRSDYTLLSLPARSTSCTGWWVSNPHVVQNCARPKKLYGRTESIGVVAIPLLRMRTAFKQPWRRCCSAANFSLASRLVALRTIVRGFGHCHRRVSILLLRRSQAVKVFCRPGTRMRRSTKVSASILVGATARLVVVGAPVKL